MSSQKDIEQNFQKNMNPSEGVATSGNGQEPEISNRETLALELIHDLNRSARIRAAICNLILDPEDEIELEGLEQILDFVVSIRTCGAWNK